MKRSKTYSPYHVDIHCHPTFMPYNRSHIEKTTISEFWPPMWSLEKVEKQRDSDTPQFTQSDFTTLSQCTVRVCFASLLPLEQGFVWYKGKAWAMIMARILYLIPFLRSCHVQSASHDYFEDLGKEYNLLTTEANWECPGEVAGTNYKAKVVSNYGELIETVNEGTIAIVTTIEGGHSLGGGSKLSLKAIPDDSALDNVRDQLYMTDLQLDDNSFLEPSIQCGMVDKFQSDAVKFFVLTLLKHIEEVKNWGNGQFAPFFITFSHHFWNQLCGHAISLPRKLGYDLMDQHRGLEEPMTEVGKVIVCALLSKNNGKRVLIDTKHMSLAGKDWYYGCVEKFNKGLPDELKIPIISSHSAGNGIKQMPKEGQKDTAQAYENYDTSTDRFNIWEINLSDEEILRIHESNGLIGLNFDERILSGHQWRDELKLVDSHSSDWVKPIAEHLYHIASVIQTKAGGNPIQMAWDEQVTRKLWRRLAMGSDFDGAINPVNAYCRATDFVQLEQNLKNRLAEMRDHIDIGDAFSLGDYPLLVGLQDSNIAQIVDWFMRGNAMDFLKMYFTDEYRS